MTACAAALAALAAPAPASAVTHVFFGTQPGVQRAGDADYAKMAAGGLGTVRIQFSWASVEPQRGERNWSATDARVSGAARAGLDPLALLLGSPSFAAAQSAWPPSSNDNLAAWQRFVGDFVHRYGRGGTFWAAHPELPYRPITSYQVWNEPNFNYFWNNRPSAQEYVSFLGRTRHAIKAQDPRAGIVLAGVAYGNHGEDTFKYLDELYRARMAGGVRRLFDAVAVHPYARRPSEISGFLDATKNVMRRHRDGGKTIWVTETGWANGGPSSPFTTTTAGQSNDLVATMHLLVDHRSRWRIGRVFWFDWQDPSARSPDSFQYHTGLLDSAGRNKRAWGGYKAFIRHALR